MTLTLTDLFCGAGGSSTGAIAVPGLFDEAGDPNPGAFYRAVAADDQLFGTGTDVYLRQPEQVDQLIRSAAQS
ncbi:hypothetical protein [Mycobacterium avium]|uniref:hypothetical protein n=1 Tax=Mycobacterium avium TaxID=1764 RepID=UPI001CC614C7|nr:hypothetical protein [Mycobacterium avium]